MSTAREDLSTLPHRTRALISRRAFLVGVAMLAPAFFTLTTGGCSDDTDPATTTNNGGAGAGGSSTTVTTVGGGASDAGTDAPIDQYCDGYVPPRPESVPADWSPWTCVPNCTFWLAPQTNMPPPIEWEDCEIDHGFECEQMKNTWAEDGNAFGGMAKLDTRGPVPSLMFSRFASQAEHPYNDILVAALEGDVRFSARIPLPSSCYNVPYDYADQRLAIGVSHKKGGNTDIDVLMMLDPGEQIPRLAYYDDTPSLSDWYVGADLIVRGQTPDSALWLHDPAFSLTELMHSPATDPEGLRITGYPTIIGQDVIFSVGSLQRQGVMAHDSTGTHELVRWVGDATRGASNAATDGVHLVWTQGEGKEPEEWEYPVRDIMVSPFTTDPNQLQPKRLRSDPSAIMGTVLARFEVGCGYAMREGSSPSHQLIVRLSDGQSWQLTGMTTPPNIWKWSDPLGFTCDHAYIGVSSPSGTNITRVRLDSLGPGMPPD